MNKVLMEVEKLIDAGLDRDGLLAQRKRLHNLHNDRLDADDLGLKMTLLLCISEFLEADGPAPSTPSAEAINQAELERLREVEKSYLAMKAMNGNLKAAPPRERTKLQRLDRVMWILSWVIIGLLMLMTVAALLFTMPLAAESFVELYKLTPHYDGDLAGPLYTTAAFLFAIVIVANLGFLAVMLAPRKRHG
jgi:hypothetical protein